MPFAAEIAAAAHLAKHGTLPPDADDAEQPEQMQRRATPTRYGKAKRRLTVHPLLKGTQLSLALRELAKDKDGTVANLSKHVLTRDPSATLALADALEETNHPWASLYNWRAVPEKLLHDAATLQLTKRLAHQRRRQRTELGIQPGRLLHAANGVLRDARDADSLGHAGEYGQQRAELKRRFVEHLRGQFPHVTDRHIDDSLARVHQRVNDRMWDDNADLREWMRQQRSRDATTPVETKRARLDNFHRTRDAETPPTDADHARRAKERHASEALHFARYRVGGIAAALRLLRSKNQQRTRGVFADVLAKLGLNPAKTRNAIAASGAPVASVAAAIYHGGNEAASEAAGAWLGHLTQLPAVTVFHADPKGPDAVYKLSLALDPSKAADVLHGHGVSRVVLTPTKTGTDALVHDPGRRVADRVAAAAAAANATEVQATRGRSVRFGGSGDQRADATARRSYRDAISQFEGANGRDPAR